VAGSGRGDRSGGLGGHLLGLLARTITFDRPAALGLERRWALERSRLPQSRLIAAYNRSAATDPQPSY
jgi:hypothetical protein